MSSVGNEFPTGMSLSEKKTKKKKNIESVYYGVG